jgi:hypothetical protein
MARSIYEIKLKNRYFPALSAAEALEIQMNGEFVVDINEDAVDISCALTEEHTMKLFILAKTMYDSEKFEYDEVQTAVRSLAIKFGCVCNYEAVADCILAWTERIGEDMTISELQDWIIG